MFGMILLVIYLDMGVFNARDLEFKSNIYITVAETCSAAPACFGFHHNGMKS